MTSDGICSVQEQARDLRSAKPCPQAEGDDMQSQQ